MVVITPSTDTGWPAELLHLARRGNAPAVLLLDAASFDGSLPAAPAIPQSVATAPGLSTAEDGQELGDRLAGLRSLLAEQGVPTHLIDHEFVFRPLYRIRRTRTELRTLAATGRVIEVEVEELV